MMISTTPMNNLPDIAVNWTVVTMNFQYYLDVLSKYKVSNSLFDTKFPSLDLTRLNMTWESLVKSLMALQNMDK